MKVWVKVVIAVLATDTIRALRLLIRRSRGISIHSMASSSTGSSNDSGGDFDLFEALCSQPDLLELVVEQCGGNKNNMRLACSRLRAAVDACVTGLTWKDRASRQPRAWIPLKWFPEHYPFSGAPDEAKHIAVLARCPRLQTLDFNGHHVADSSPLSSCIGLRRITRICVGDDVAPFSVLKHLEHLDCSRSFGLTDISALTASSALKYLDCSWTKIKHLPPLSVCLEMLICCHTPLPDISSLAACMALKHLDCSSTRVQDLSPLAACVGLCSLDCRRTMVQDLCPLAACAGLRFLDCSHTMVQDLCPLAACAGLRSLDCRFNRVEKLTPVLACKRLEFLRCNRFGFTDQIKQLRLARPDLDIRINRDPDADDYSEYEDEEDEGGDGDDEDEGDDEGDADGGKEDEGEADEADEDVQDGEDGDGTDDKMH